VAHFIRKLGGARLQNTSKFVQHTKAVSSSSRLFFPEKIKYVSVEDKIVVLSPLTANWLVISEPEKQALDRLVAGDSLKVVSDWASKNLQPNSFNHLLAQIFAREFASSDAPPTPLVDQTVKNGAYFYLTNACNLSCTHCYMSSGSAEKNELTLAEWISLTNKFADAGGKSITFSGGEILAKRGWLSIIRRANANGLSVTLLTNGTMWSSKDIKDVGECISEVQISLDGPSEHINAMTRGIGNFSKAIETAKIFASSGVRTSIAMTPTRETMRLFEDELSDFFDQNIKGSGINIRISHKLLPDRSGDVLNQSEKQEYENITKKLAHKIYNNSVSRAFSIAHQPNVTQTNCGLGGLTVSSTGDVYPCNRISDVSSCGNIRNIDIIDLIRDLDKISEGAEVDRISPCKNCDLRYICGGGCRIDEFFLQGDSEERLTFRHLSPSLDRHIIKEFCPDTYKDAIIKRLIDVNYYLFPRNG
jgi:radical SAM protein with 4Fe4S-binding SPASM domain